MTSGSFVKQVGVASAAAVTMAILVGLVWLALFVWMYGQGRYDAPFLATHTHQIFVALISAVVAFSLVMFRIPRDVVMPGKVKTLGFASASTVLVVGTVSLLWLALWTSYGIRVENFGMGSNDVPLLTTNTEQVAIISSAAVFLFAVVAYRGSRAPRPVGKHSAGSISTAIEVR